MISTTRLLPATVTSLPLFVLEQFVLDGVHQRFPTGLDDVVVTPTVPQVSVPSVLSMMTRVLAAVPLPAVEDAHFVVDQLHLGDASGITGSSA